MTSRLECLIERERDINCRIVEDIWYSRCRIIKYLVGGDLWVVLERDNESD